MNARRKAAMTEKEMFIRATLEIKRRSAREMTTSIGAKRLRSPWQVRGHCSERRHIGLQKNENSHQRRQRDAMKKDIAQDLPFPPVIVCGRARHHNALRIHHFSHYATGTVGRAH